jgi:WD40 repeat protein
MNTVEAWSIDISPNDKLLAAGTQSGNVNLWDMTTKDKVMTLYIHILLLVAVVFLTLK